MIQICVSLLQLAVGSFVIILELRLFAFFITKEK